MERVPRDIPNEPETKSEPETGKGEFKQTLERATELAHKTITELHKRRPDGSQNGDC